MRLPCRGLRHPLPVLPDGPNTREKRAFDGFPTSPPKHHDSTTTALPFHPPIAMLSRQILRSARTVAPQRALAAQARFYATPAAGENVKAPVALFGVDGTYATALVRPPPPASTTSIGLLERIRGVILMMSCCAARREPGFLFRNRPPSAWSFGIANGRRLCVISHSTPRPSRRRRSSRRPRRSALWATW